jgi:hypothetical protein
MKKSLLVCAFAASFSVIAAGSAFAAPLVPYCPGGPQPLPGATFGGSGIPNDAVCVADFGDLTLGFTATQRFNNPTVTNDGTDTFFAGAGDDSANGQPAYGQWNFNFYAHNDSTFATYTLRVLFDTNAGTDTDVSQFGYVSFVLAPGQTIQDSWNLGMGFIDAGAPVAGIYAPAAGLFSPTATGQYGFAVTGIDAQGGIQGIGAFVEVASAPEPASLALLGMGVLGLGARFRRRFI